MKKNTFAERLKELRKGKGYTQEFLGQMMGYNKSAICDWETRGKEPKFDTLIHLADNLDVSTDYLLGVEQKRRKNH